MTVVILYIFPLLDFFLYFCLISFLHSHMQVFGKALLHELHISYNQPEWNLLSLYSEKLIRSVCSSLSKIDPICVQRAVKNWSDLYAGGCQKFWSDLYAGACQKLIESVCRGLWKTDQICMQGPVKNSDQICMQWPVCQKSYRVPLCT